MKKTIKILIKGILFAFIAIIILFNISLYHKTNFKKNDINKIKFNLDVYHQLCFLKSKLKTESADKMQEIFPEGSVFINTLYGLTWAELIENQPENSKLFIEGINEISWVLSEIDKPDIKSLFNYNLPLKYGAFYRGWRNYLLGKKIEIQSEINRDSNDIKAFKKTCKQIDSVLSSNKSPYLETYIDNKWPADGIIAVSSLKLHDVIFKTNRYESQLNSWILKIKTNLDPKTGLIPHSIQAQNDEITEGTRGSSQSLILVFIKDIDSVFAKNQFLKYKKHFLDYRLGMPGIREYPKNQKGSGDIDSGPVIFDIGGAASIVGQKTMGLYKDWSHYNALKNCIETFGVGFTRKNEKKYIFGQLPIADAFIAWSNVSEKDNILLNNRIFWRIKIQLISLILCFLFWIMIKKLS